MIKILHKLGIEGNFLNLIDYLQIPITNIILNIFSLIY